MPTAHSFRSRPGSARAQRIAITAIFTIDGAVFGTWAARIPDVTMQVGASHASLGVVLLCISLGALAGMQVTGGLCARFGAGRVTAAATAATAAAITLPGLADSVPPLGAALFLFGLTTGVLNVAANTAGVGVERALGRPVISSLHAGFSVGGLAGAGLTGLVVGVPVSAHFLVLGLLALTVAAVAAPVLRSADLAPPMDGPAGEPAGTRPTGATRRLVVLFGLVAGATAFAEGAVTDWGALYLRETLGATPALAAAGYGVFSLAMAAGRVAGSRLLARFGETALLTGGCLAAAGGALIAATATEPVQAVAAFAVIGLGLANVFPVALARAGALAGGGGIALASTVGYTGLLGGPPLFGFLAGAAGIGSGFIALAAITLAAAALTVHAAHAWPAARARAGRSVVAVVRPTLHVGTSALRAHAAALTTLWPAEYASAPAPRPTRRRDLVDAER